MKEWFKDLLWVVVLSAIVTFVFILLSLMGINDIYITAIIGATNIVALFYAILIYRRYEEKKDNAINELKELGINTTKDEAIDLVQGFIKWYRENKESIDLVKDLVANNKDKLPYLTEMIQDKFQKLDQQEVTIKGDNDD